MHAIRELIPLTHDEFSCLVHIFDKDGDGEIEYKEFQAFMQGDVDAIHDAEQRCDARAIPQVLNIRLISA